METVEVKPLKHLYFELDQAESYYEGKGDEFLSTSELAKNKIIWRDIIEELEVEIASIRNQR